MAFEEVMRIAGRYFRRVIFELYNSPLVAFRMLIPWECKEAAKRVLELCEGAGPNEYLSGLKQHFGTDIENASQTGFISGKLAHNLETTLRRMPLTVQEGETTNKIFAGHGDRFSR